MKITKTEQIKPITWLIDWEDAQQSSITYQPTGNCQMFTIGHIDRIFTAEALLEKYFLKDEYSRIKILLEETSDEYFEEVKNRFLEIVKIVKKPRLLADCLTTGSIIAPLIEKFFEGNILYALEYKNSTHNNMKMYIIDVKFLFDAERKKSGGNINPEGFINPTESVSTAAFMNV